METAFVGLGSNLGNGKNNLQTAWRLLELVEGITTRRLSSPYLTAPVGMDTAQWFTNAVGMLETSLPPEQLHAEMMRIELQMGRRRDQTRDRQIDLDLLYYGHRVLALPDLTVPHPELHKRLFVLAPLAEIAPEYLHPVLKLSSAAMLAAIPPGQTAEKSDWQFRSRFEIT
jgi:2-amino-4-hydroxy-6-hydroxymethyldihydropteridine diphosphokinase